MRAGDRVIRVSTTAAVLVVAAVAAYASYLHAVEVILRWGSETRTTAHLVPLTIDGLVGASSMVMLWTSRYRLPVPSLARWALGTGVAATLAANVLHGLSRGPLAAGIAAWPAVALVISYELLMWIVKSGRELADAHPPQSEAYEPQAAVDGGPQHSPGEAYETNRAHETPDVMVPVPKVPATVPKVPVAPVSDPSPNPVPLNDSSSDPSPLVDADRMSKVSEWLMSDPSIAGAEIGRRLGLTPRQGLRIRNAVRASMNGRAA